jgi:hypothetical protein
MMHPVRVGFPLHRLALIGVLLALAAPALAANYLDFCGYTDLVAELGGAVPTGAGVTVLQAEAYSDGYSFVPTPGDATWTGKNLIYCSGSPGSSGHATGVARTFYGNSGMGSGITDILAYSAGSWLSSSYVSPGSAQPLAGYNDGGTMYYPRVSNHSWIGGASSTQMARVDWLVENDDHFVVGAMNNSGAGGHPETQWDVMMGLYNGVATGVTNIEHSYGTAASGGIYTAGRVRPHFVAPAGFTSNAAPIVAAMAAVLIETGHTQTGLSNGSYVSERTGATIYHAETSESIKAALMAGADRFAPNDGTSTNGAIYDYEVDTPNGLDLHYGAGQVNIQNSYHILAAGEQDSSPAGGAGEASQRGFDYAPAFARDDVATYRIAPESGNQWLTAALVWNLDIDGGTPTSFNAGTTLYDLDLRLYDVTGGGRLELFASDSDAENTENVYYALAEGSTYELEVTAPSDQPDFTWDYSLAWNVSGAWIPGDFNYDGVVDVEDVDNLADAIRFGSQLALRDLNHDGTVDQADLDYLLMEILGTTYGDANVDGMVSDADYTIWADHYGETSAEWSEGDFNLNGTVTEADYTIWADNYGFGVTGDGDVPEPATALLLVLAGVCLPRRRRREAACPLSEGEASC